MNDNYDAIVLGTGLTECVISGLLSVNGYKVLHMDKNNYYGGECASLNLEQLFEKFRPGKTPSDSLGRSRDYNIDLVPKFLMANGKLVKILRRTGVTRYNMEFMLCDGSYVAKSTKIHKVPATDVEALKSPLMGLFEKRRCRKFLIYGQNYKEDEPKTHEGLDLNKVPMKAVYDKFSLQPDTIEFIGHAIALYTNDEYLEQPALPAIKRLQLYEESLRMYGKSPYVYPLYGLGELPQVFARLSAVYGGTYMLAKPVDKIVFNDKGEACGVVSEGETANCKFIVGDPSYFQDKVKKTGRVVRCICILNHTIPNTDDAKSVQIIIPQNQCKRKNDVYVFMTSFNHKVAPQGKYIAIVSTQVETNNPEDEVKAGLDLIGAVEDKFFSVVDSFEPVQDGKNDKCFISKSYDAQSHFETVGDDILSLYKRITGQDYDWSAEPDAEPGAEDKHGN